MIKYAIIAGIVLLFVLIKVNKKNGKKDYYDKTTKNFKRWHK